MHLEAMRNLPWKFSKFPQLFYGNDYNILTVSAGDDIKAKHLEKFPAYVVSSKLLLLLSIQPTI